MTFNKLLIVFALATLSLCSRKVINVDKKEDIPKNNYDYVTFTKYPKWNSDGLIRAKEAYTCTNDFTTGYAYLKDVEVAASFRAIEDEKIKSLKIGAPITFADELKRFDYTKCASINALASYQELLAYAAYFYDNDNDIIPSIAYNLKNGPKSQEYRQNVDDKVYLYPEAFNDNCHRGFSNSRILSSVYYNGIVDESCIPNDFSTVPGWDKALPTSTGDQYEWDKVNGSAPKIDDKCAGDGKFKAILKKNGIGNILPGANLTTLKEVITTYGPVYANLRHAKADSSITTGTYPGWRLGSSEDELFTGWDATKLYFVGHFYDQTTDFNEVDEILISETGTYSDSTGVHDITYDDFIVTSAQFIGNGISVVRAAFALIAAAVVLPALALFF